MAELPFDSVSMLTLIPYLENSSTSFGEGNGTPLQRSCLKIPWTEVTQQQQQQMHLLFCLLFNLLYNTF